MPTVGDVAVSAPGAAKAFLPEGQGQQHFVASGRTGFMRGFMGFAWRVDLPPRIRSCGVMRHGGARPGAATGARAQGEEGVA